MSSAFLYAAARTPFGRYGGALADDVALIGAHRADRMGNLVYRKTARNFGPVMATAAATTIVQVHEIVDAGEIDPEVVVTPGIFVDRVVSR